MAKPITPFSISAPGFLGLNTQDSPVGMDKGFALEASNCVIDKYGRVGSRKGWAATHTTNADLGTSNIECVGELTESDGTLTTLAAGGGFLFTLASGTLTTLTYGGGGAAPTITANNWQFVQLGGVGVFFQRGYDPLIYDPAVSTSTFRRLSEKAGYTGTVPTGNCALSAYGRLWVADTATDKNTITWSDTLTTHLWTGGASGSLNLLGVWPHGGDEIVALAAHNNQLIIFGRQQTLVYTGADDPSTMTLTDALDSVGCVARDSIQNIGSDLIFLSDDGVRSLMRTIQEKSAPMRNLSRNVQNDIQAYINVEGTDDIKSGYSPDEGFYVITFPTGEISYCFDTRLPLQDGSLRVTTWGGIPSKAFCYTKGRKLYLGKAGYVGEYSTYLDNATEYRISYYTPWIDFGNPIQTSILKKIFITLIGATNQPLVYKWGFDFNTGTAYQSTSLSGLSAASEYGIAEYGIAEYQGNLIVNTASVNATGSGKLIQIGFEAQILGYSISIQKIDIFTKEGRL